MRRTAWISAFVLLACGCSQPATDGTTASAEPSEPRIEIPEAPSGDAGSPAAATDDSATTTVSLNVPGMH